MKLCIAGKNNIAVDCLQYSLTFMKRSDVFVLPNNNDLSKNTWQKSLSLFANKNNVEIKSLEEIQGIENIIFISLEYDKIINPKLFQSKKLYNIHFSYLPEYKGMYTSLFPIIHGKCYSGVTLHCIDRGIDTGDIIDQTKFDINNLSCRELYFIYMKEGVKLFSNNIHDLLSGDYLKTPQPIWGSSYFSKSSFKFSDTEIPINSTAFQIQQFTKALNFREYQLAKFNNVKIQNVDILSKKSIKRPGSIIEENDHYFEIATVDYDIRLYKDYYDDLLICCRTGNIKYAQTIIKFIRDINESNEDGWNPLIIACYHGSWEIADLLLNYNANPFVTNLNGSTTLMYAKDGFLKNRDFKILKKLIEKGVDVNTKDILGKCVFDYTDDVELLKYFKN